MLELAKRRTDDRARWHIVEDDSVSADPASSAHGDGADDHRSYPDLDVVLDGGTIVRAGAVSECHSMAKHDVGTELGGWVYNYAKTVAQAKAWSYSGADWQFDPHERLCEELVAACDQEEHQASRTSLARSPTLR